MGLGILGLRYLGEVQWVVCVSHWLTHREHKWHFARSSTPAGKDLTNDFTTRLEVLEVKKSRVGRRINVKPILLGIQEPLCATLGWGYSDVCTAHNAPEHLQFESSPSFPKLKTARRQRVNKTSFDISLIDCKAQLLDHSLSTCN